MKRIVISVESSLIEGEQHTITLVKQSHFGREFGFNGDRYFIASNGIILNSNCPRFKAHPRINTLAFPTNPEEFEKREDILLDIYPKTTFFIDGILNAVIEYNSKEP